MSATQHLAPLSLFSEESDWPVEFGTVRPEGWKTSRNPTVRELRQVIASLKGYEIWDNLDAGEPIWVGSVAEGVNVVVENYLPVKDQDMPRRIYFDGDSILEMRLVEKLAHLCGPQLLAESSTFVIVEAGTPPDTPWQFWPRRF